MDSIHLPNAISLPTAFGAPGTPLPTGQVVQALVLALIESDVFRLQLPQAIVDVRSDVPLTPGSTITLAVKGGASSTRLVIYSDPSTPAPAGPGASASLVGRHPVGEAVVIARAGTAAPAHAQPAMSKKPAVTRDVPSVSPARLPPQPEAPAVRAVTPQQAVGEALRAAAPRQTGLAPLYADIEQVIQSTDRTLPPPVRRAADNLLSLRIPLEPSLTASKVKQAFVRSGVLFEPRLAAAQAVSVVADADILTPAPASDLKAALLVMRQVLKAWAASEPAPNRNVTLSTPLPDPNVARPAPATDRSAATPTPVPDRRAAPPTPAAPPTRALPPQASDAGIKHLANALAGAPAEAVPDSALSPEQATTLAKTVASALTARETPSIPAPATTSGPPPPYRGAPLSAQPPAASSIMQDTAPHEAAERLIAQADGALARQTLLQVASLPDQPDLPRAEAGQRWTFEIPFASPQGTTIAHFEVSRDGHSAKSDPEARTWRARFSLDVEPMGAVHAMIALSGTRTSVTLWAERASTASRLQDNATMLNEALRAAELEPADLQLRVGAPPAIRQAAPGRFMDRAT